MKAVRTFIASNGSLTSNDIDKIAQNIRELEGKEEGDLFTWFLNKTYWEYQSNKTEYTLYIY